MPTYNDLNRESFKLLRAIQSDILEYWTEDDGTPTDLATKRHEEIERHCQLLLKKAKDRKPKGVKA